MSVDGPRGFCVAIAACLVQFTVFGVMNSFSIFAKDMSNDVSLGNPSQTESSFGNSVGVGLSPVFGAFAGTLADRIGARFTCLVAVFAMFIGLWLSASFANNALTLVLLFSVPAGVASGFMLSPGAAAASSWFRKYRTLGTGIAFCGGGLGSCVVPALAGSWSSTYGWRTSFKFMSSFCGVGALAALAVSYHPSQAVQEVDACDTVGILETCEAATPLSSRHLSLKELAHDVVLTKPFMSHFASFALFTWSFYGILYMTVPYASSMGKADSAYADVEVITIATASTLMTSFGVLQIVGSISMGYVGGRIGNKLTHAVCSIGGAVGYFYLIFCRSYAEFAVALSIIGFATAGVFAVVPAMVANTYNGPNVGTIIGFTFFAAVIGGFSAPPLLSVLQASNNGNYSYGLIIMTIAQAVSGMILFLTVHEK